MGSWQLLLKNGNENFAQKQWPQALNCYQQAVELLDELWSQDHKNINILMAWISSLHNLSTLYEVQNNSPLAMHYLIEAHQRLSELLLSRNHNHNISTELQLVLLRGFNLTLAPILALNQRYPDCVSCQSGLRHAKTLMRITQSRMH